MEINQPSSSSHGGLPLGNGQKPGERLRQVRLSQKRELADVSSELNIPLFRTCIRSSVVITEAQALQQQWPQMPVFAAGQAEKRKLSAGWLIEQAGWKGYRQGDAGVSPDHALVLVNHGQATGAQLLALAREIAASVQQRFGVAIEPEPRLIGAQW